MQKVHNEQPELDSTDVDLRATITTAPIQIVDNKPPIQQTVITQPTKPQPLMSLMSLSFEKKAPTPSQLDNNSQANAKNLEKNVLTSLPNAPMKHNTILEMIMLNRNKKRYAEIKRAYGKDESVQEMLFERIDLLTDMHMLMNYDFCHKLPKTDPAKVAKKKPKSNIQQANKNLNTARNQVKQVETEDGELDENDENSSQIVTKLEVVDRTEQNNEKVNCVKSNQTRQPENRQRHEKQSAYREPNRSELRDKTRSRSRNRASRSRTRSRSTSRNKSRNHVRKRSRDRRSRSRLRSRSRGNSSRRSYLTQSSKYANNDNKQQKSRGNNRNDYNNRRQDHGGSNNNSNNKRTRMN
jgi:hypothetical protein